MRRRTLSRLLEPKSITFGFTVFYFIWTFAAWRRAPSYDHYEEVFITGALCVAATGLVLDKVWSKLLAAILCGQMPLIYLLIFWVAARDTEVVPFSPRHISIWLHELARIPPGPWLWLVVSSIILAYAAPAIVRASVRHKPAHNA
jgi:hypothetical protein